MQKKISSLLIILALCITSSVNIYAAVPEAESQNVNEVNEFLKSLNQEYETSFYIPSASTASARSNSLTDAPMTDIVTAEKIANATPQEIEQLKRELAESAREISNFSSYEIEVSSSNNTPSAIAPRANERKYVERGCVVIGGVMRYEGYINKHSDGKWYWEVNNLRTWVDELASTNPAKYQFFCERVNKGTVKQPFWVCTHPITYHNLGTNSQGQKLEVWHKGELFTKTVVGWMPEKYTVKGMVVARP